MMAILTLYFLADWLKMYTLDQKMEIVKYWYETKLYVTVCHMFTKNYGFCRQPEPAKLMIQRIVHPFEKEKTLLNCNKGQSGQDSVISPKKKKRNCQSVVNSLKKSHCKCAQELKLSRSTIWRVMTNDLMLFPYKISTNHALKEQDKEKCIVVWEWFNDQLEQTPSWLNHIWFSDEAHFHLNGAVNNHNNIFWGEQAPEEISEKQLKGVKVTAFIAFNTKHSLLGPYWFEECGKMITVNSPRYCVIMQRFHNDLSQKLTPRQLRLTWFM